MYKLQGDQMEMTHRLKYRTAILTMDHRIGYLPSDRFPYNFSYKRFNYGDHQHSKGGKSTTRVKIFFLPGVSNSHIVAIA